MTYSISASAIAISVLGLLACSNYHTEPSGPIEHLNKTIELDKSEAVRVTLKMGAGELRIQGGATNLMEADCEYNVPSWKPDIRYDDASFRSHIDIEQPSVSGSLAGDHHYVWNLRFNDDKPMSFSMEVGAGVANLTMGSLNLQNLELKMGVGKVDLDLHGTPKADYQVRLHGGVGQADVHLPKGVAIVADARGGIGSIDARGLQKRGNRYINDEYEKGGKTTIRLDIEGGIGQINLIAD